MSRNAPPPPYTVPDFGGLWSPSIVTLPPHGWGVAFAQVGPDLAQAMLRYNADNQRRQINASIERFAVDMAAGQWRLTHQGVAFNRRGQLFDGQNRLVAVIESGATVPLYVWFGVGGEAEMVATDTGVSRTQLDAVHVQRITADKYLMSTVQSLYRHARPGRGTTVKLSAEEAIKLVKKYGEPARLVNSWFVNPRLRGVDRSPIRAAVLAALAIGQHAPDRLERFVLVLTEKLPPFDEADSAASVLRRYIVNNVGSGASSVVGADLYFKTCWCIQQIASGREVKGLKAVAESPWFAFHTTR